MVGWKYVCVCVYVYRVEGWGGGTQTKMRRAMPSARVRVGATRALHALWRRRFYGAIRKIMSSHANDRSVCTVQNECPLICKALCAERAQSSPRMEIRRRWRRHSAPRRTDSIIYPLFSLSLSFSSFLPPLPPLFLRYPLPPCLFPALSLWILSHLDSTARAYPRLPGDSGTSGYF